MPVTKPTTLPRWATGGSAEVVEPSSGEKDLGWSVAQKPPAQHMNWIQKSTYQWLEWLKDIENQAITWTASHTFSAANTFALGQVWQALQNFAKGITLNGDTDTSPLVEGLRVPSPSSRQLIARFPTTGGHKARIYVSATGFELTYNCYFDGAAWRADASAHASILSVESDNVGVFTSGAIVGAGNVITFDGMRMNGGTSPVANTVQKPLLVKANAVLTGLGGGAFSCVGTGIASASGTNVVNVNLSVPMADTNYTIYAAPRDGSLPMFLLYAVPNSVSQFAISWADAAGAQINVGTAAGKTFSVQVIGNQ